MKRFNSDPFSTPQSSVIAGNLDNFSRSVETPESLSDDENLDDDLIYGSVDEPIIKSDYRVNEHASGDEITKADNILFDMYGVNVISLLSKMIVSGDMLPDEFVIQSLAYKCQFLVRGKTGVRYERSWGLFWSSIRNIIKSRGIVPFLDHFPVPSKSQLVKYKGEAMKMCGLEKATIGRPGVQRSSTELWINSKTKESNGQLLVVSASMDGKKIAVSSSDDATEDMGGIDEYSTKEEADVHYNDMLKQMKSLINQNDRQSLFKFYDQLSCFSQEVVSKMHALQILQEVNSKRLDKNPNLSKYIHVLKSKALVGEDLLAKFCIIQRDVIEMIAEKRKASHLLPQNNAVCLSTQDNYQALKPIEDVVDRTNLYLINKMTNNEHLLEISWPRLMVDLGETFKFSRDSKSFKHLVELCYLTSEQAFIACGLGKTRPVQEMKSIYSQSHAFPSALKPPELVDSNVVATFCSIVAPMTFGLNCVVKESGIFIKNGISSIPDLLVCNLSNDIEYCVKSHNSRSQIFTSDLDIVAQSVVDSYLCDANKGGLVLRCNEKCLVVMSVPSDNQLAQKILAFCGSYVNAKRCLTKRSQDMISEQEQIKHSLIDIKDRVTIIGSYPMSNESEQAEPELSTKLPISKLPNKILGELNKVMCVKRSFLSKEARELVAINISDMSGNQCDSPHTFLAATFLSSSSLKVVGEKCLKEVIEMVEERNCVCMNIGVDGESIHLATMLPDGTPGTELSLARAILKQLQTLSKDSLVKMLSKNPLIDIRCRHVEEEENEEQDDPKMDALVDNLEDTLVLVQESQSVDVSFTLEDIETMLTCDSTFVDPVREAELKSYKVSELRMVGLKHIFPQLRRCWMIQNMGQEKISIFFQDGDKVDCSLNNVFQKTNKGFFRTVTFDFAHIINLFRESLATGKLENLGVRIEKIVELSKKEGFGYLEQIIALKNGKLKFDSMNQKCSSNLFSAKTVVGLRSLKDFEGAKAIEVVSNGLLAMDESGVRSDQRVKALLNLKNFLLEKNNVLDRLKRPDKRHITNELFQMTLCSIDSHICTYLNLEFFNPRRKSTSSVESLFGQLMMMTDGCSKLNVRQLHDVLQRLALSNAVRLLPLKVRGFKFLSYLKRHMTSYKPEEFEDSEVNLTYPKVKLSDGSIRPADSLFDKKRKKSKPLREKIRTLSESSFDGNVRKYHKKIN